MKIRFVAVLVLVTCLLAGSLYSIPGNGTQVTQVLTRSDSALGSTYVGTTLTNFSANAYDDQKGVAQGTVSVISQDSSAGTYSYIQCSGQDYANIVSVNSTSGDTIVNATLNPASPSCSSYSVSSPITISLTGQFDGVYQESRIGANTTTSDGTSFKSNFSYDSFSETFTGTIGHASGPFSGNSNTTRFNNRTRVK
jgi:hypothetical protein